MTSILILPFEFLKIASSAGNLFIGLSLTRWVSFAIRTGVDNTEIPNNGKSDKC